MDAGFSQGLLTLYVGLSCSAATGLLQLSPGKPACIFTAYEGFTCNWTAARDAPPDTTYSLEANMTLPQPGCSSAVRPAFSCVAGRHTQCSGSIISHHRLFSIRVTAHSAIATASSPTLCVNATDAVKLRAPVLSDLRPAQSGPGCLEVLWHKPKNFALSDEDFCSGSMPVQYQFQYWTEEEQAGSHMVQGVMAEHLQQGACVISLSEDQSVRLGALCFFRAFTRYTLLLRQRHGQLWSNWSMPLQACTGTTAPTEAPELWRTIQNTDVPHRRLVTLLWKLPARSQAACARLWFDASCRVSPSQNAVCSNMTESSCQLALPTEPCSCSVTMGNAAGASPPALLVLPPGGATGPAVLDALSLRPLDDATLQVTWSAPPHPFLSSFLVEWVSASEAATNQSLHWERVGSEAHHMTIADLQPEVLYTVTVTPELGRETGRAVLAPAYTREGVPSSGPQLEVQEQGNRGVLLVWEPVPAQQLRGFITAYTLYWQMEVLQGGTAGHSSTLPPDRLWHRFSAPAGVYRFTMTTHTVAGEGRPGPPLMLTLEEDYSISTILTYLLPAIFIVVMLLLFIVFCRERIRQMVWPKVPDPSRSSVTAWGFVPPLRRSLYTRGHEDTSLCRLAGVLHRHEPYYPADYAL